MRLIDADKVMEILADRWCNTNGEKAKCYHDAFNILKNQPTLYDIDKVIVELETAREDYFNDYQSAVVYGLTLAIEIIMRGYEDNERL